MVTRTLVKDITIINEGQLTHADILIESQIWKRKIKLLLKSR